MNTIRPSLRLAFSLLFAATGLTAATAATPELSRDHVKVIRNGDPDQLRDLLSAGFPVEARDEFGNTALIHAAAYAGFENLRLLLERGAEVNATNLAGATALMRAATDLPKLELLLQHGADVRPRSALGNTALMLAARAAGSHRAVAALLAHGADVNATNLWGANALMAAAAGGDVESARLLLAAGADPNAQPGASHDAFILGGGRSPLNWAAYRGNIEMIKLLLEAGADVNAVGMFGTALGQAAWADRTDAAELLIARGARVDRPGVFDGFTPLHWAASSEENNPALVNLLLRHGADPNRGGGEEVAAFLGTPQTPLMLAKRRGETTLVEALVAAGATNATPDRLPPAVQVCRDVPAKLDLAGVVEAVNRALPPLQTTSIESKSAYVRHASKQDCTSCHQQYLPMAAIGWAKKLHATVDAQAEAQLIKMVGAGELKMQEADWEALFHPDPVHTKGYALLGWAAARQPADSNIDAWVHHLASIQGPDGQWYNNLPRPPIQSGDISATALAIHALQAYPLPGRKAEFAERVDRARRWLWSVQAQNSENRAYQVLGLAWAGEPANRLRGLIAGLIAEQRPDGGWAQLPSLKTDAYATGQAVFALCTAGGLDLANPAVEKGTRLLLRTQLDDGTWYVRRRAFPFQPTMNSGFPHGRDSWISAAGSSWAVMALSASTPGPSLVSRR